MIIFFGSPGSGKSMQGQLMATRHGWRWVSTGELLRQTNDSEIEKILKSGNMVSDEIVNELLFESIKENNKIILDGYPRNLEQTKLLIDKFGDKLSTVIVLSVSVEEVEKRLSLRKRTGDDKEVITYRIKQYEDATNPILNEFSENGINIEYVDGVGKVGEVHDRIEDKLEGMKIMENY